MKKILEELFHAVEKLENFNILEVPSLFEVADVVAAATKMLAIMLDKDLDKIGAKKDNYALLHKAQILGKRIEELQ